MKVQEINSLKLITAPNLICAFSNRHDGNMSLSYGDTRDSLKSRQGFLAGLGVDYRDLVCAKQIHGSSVTYIREEDRGKGALAYDTSVSDTDAFITDQKNLPLAILTADCLSIFLYDAKTAAIGLVHAGWRSTEAGIAVKTIEAMKNKFNTSLGDLTVGLGPAIHKCHYHLDLIALNKKQLLDSGVKEVNIRDCGICTFCQNSDFFSYRKEGNASGRIMSVIMLK